MMYSASSKGEHTMTETMKLEQFIGSLEGITLEATPHQNANRQHG